MLHGLSAAMIPLDAVLSEAELLNAAGLIILSIKTDGLHGPKSGSIFLENALMAAKQFAPSLESAAKQGHAVFAGISFMDGAFGFNHRDIKDPFTGGLSGLIKTAAIEWEGVTCRAMDISPTWGNQTEIAKAVVDEIVHSDPSAPIEVGLTRDNRFNLILESSRCPSGTLRLIPKRCGSHFRWCKGRDSCVRRKHWPKNCPLHLCCLGRSQVPFAEPHWLADIFDEREIKKAIIAYDFKEEKASPMKVEKKYKIYAANREIQRTLKNITSSGSEAVYYSVDIRDADKMTTAIKNIHNTYGKVSAIIHGAGVVEE